MSSLSLYEAKTRLRIPDVWRHFKLPGEPRPSCKSPLRDDQTPSFSVSTDGALFNDFATGDAGDAVDFFQRASGLSRKEACRKFIELADGHPIPTQSVPRSRCNPAKIAAKPDCSNFNKGTVADLKQLASLRNIGYEGLEWASGRGLLWFATLKGHLAWIITDSARVNAQARRMDGGLWEHLETHPKAWTLPDSCASWPIGIREVQAFRSIALCEGGPDFLAAHYLALWEQATDCSRRDAHCAPVALLGANQRIHTSALPLFAGKHVRIFGHNDEAGHAAVDRWARQLQSAGVGVDAFSFAGLQQADGRPIKDLNESLMMDAASFGEAERILP